MSVLRIVWVTILICLTIFITMPTNFYILKIGDLSRKPKFDKGHFLNAFKDSRLWTNVLYNLVIAFIASIISGIIIYKNYPKDENTKTVNLVINKD